MDYEEEETEVKEEVSKLTYREAGIRAAGVCDQCHQRYTDVPVIDGKPQCPTCDKV